MIIFYKYVIDNYQPLHQLIIVQPMSYDKLTWSKFINILDHQINEKSSTIIHFYIYPIHPSFYERIIFSSELPVIDEA